MLPSSSPVPFLIARSMLSHGMFTALAASIAVRSRGLPPGSPPPLFAATVISRMTLVQEEARRASVTAFLRLICFHLLWPAMAELLEADEVWAAGRPVRGDLSHSPTRRRKHKRDSRLRQSEGPAWPLTMRGPAAT